MSVDTNGRSNGGGEPLAGEAEGAPTAPVPRQRPLTLRFGGGCEVDRSLDEFIAEANALGVDMDGWSLGGEQSARRAERDAEVRQAAESAARAEAERRLEHLERRSAEQVADLEARLAVAEERAADAEKRARLARSSGSMRAVREDPAASETTERMRAVRRRRLSAGEKLALAAIALVGAAIALVLLGGELWDREERPPAVQPAAPRLPDPVVRPMLPAEPTVTPLDDPTGARKRAKPGVEVRPQRAKKPAKAAGDGDPVDGSTH